MTPLLKRQLRAAACRDRASESEALARSSLLAHVSAKHDLAAARWRELAAMDERGPEKPPVRLAPGRRPRVAPAIPASEDTTCTV